MRKIFALSIAAAIAAATPALAQTPGYFGAPSGANTPGGGDYRMNPYAGNNGWSEDGYYNNGYRNGAGQYGYGGERFDPSNDDQARIDNGYGVPNPSGAIEGRAAVEDEAPPPRMHPRHHRMLQDDDAMSR